MIRVGIFFGGPGREREISFAGGRTVYDNLDKSLFEPIPIFVDSFRQFILLDWPYIYKGSIRDFYPPVEFLPESRSSFQYYAENLGPGDTLPLEQMVNSVGKKINPVDLPGMIDFAFLTLHGLYGEDGQIQGLLDSLGIPYSGSGILPSAIGIDKAVQKKWMKAAGWPVPAFRIITWKEWMNVKDPELLFLELKEITGLPMVVRPARQGSSIGVSMVSADDPQTCARAIDHAFFRCRLDPVRWKSLNREEKIALVRDITDIRSGTGLPLECHGETVYSPDRLLALLDELASGTGEPLLLSALDSERKVIVESFIKGREFSCIVIRTEEGRVVALPPTGILKGEEVFDYRSKYLAGLSRKVTPIDLPDDRIQAIRKACEELYRFFGFHVYARIDGFIQEDGTIFLNDPNTTSGMLPSSFFFHQAAEIGLDPSRFLTYIIRTSIRERMEEFGRPQAYRALLNRLDRALASGQQADRRQKKVAVLLGGYSSERHISVESGRNVYEKLAASPDYEPVPVFLTRDKGEIRLFRIPLNLMLKDNADDIRDKIFHFKRHPVVEEIKALCRDVTEKYAQRNYRFEPEPVSFDDLARDFDFVFLGLHGRPGEDGAVQQELEKRGIAYNGSPPKSAAITIDKYRTNEILAREGFTVPGHLIATKTDWQADEKNLVESIKARIPYPFIAKPVDDGCSSAVKRIASDEDLEAYCRLLFREEEALPEEAAARLKLKPREEIPRKEMFLVEELIGPAGAVQFLEITGGMLVGRDEKGEPVFEVFEPSEALAGEEVLSLEEKFLAGQGQNITPARFGKNQEEYEMIARQVKQEMERAARVLGVEGYCRIDAFVRIFEGARAETIIIEVNSLPGLTPATCIFHQAALNGYKPFEFIEQILQFGFERNKQKIC